MQVNAILTRAEEGGFVAFNPETGSTSQGETVDDTIANLEEAVNIYVEEFPLSRVNFWGTDIDEDDARENSR